MRKLTHKEIVARQDVLIPSPRLPLVVILNHIRSLHNVGSIFRTADGVGVEKLWLCGITGYPPNSQIAKTALGAEDQVPWEHEYDAAKVIRHYQAKGYKIVLLEQTDESQPFQNFKAQGPVCLVLGNEIEGVDDSLLALADESVEIEMAGIKNSLNVNVAFAVVAYHLRQQLKKLATG